MPTTVEIHRSMPIKVIPIIFFSLTLSQQNAAADVCLTGLPPNYQIFPAKDKLNILWDKVLATQYSYNNLPKTYDPNSFNLTLQWSPEFQAVSFTHVDDEQPPGRTRMNAAVFAVVAKVTFKTYKNT